MSTQSDADHDSEDIYNSVLRVVDHQTSPKQPPGVRPGTVRLVLVAHADIDADGVEKALRRAEDNDDLVAWRDDDGQLRLTRCTESDLKRLLGHFNTELHPPVQACERIATLIREVKDA